MAEIENTSTRDPLLHLAVAMGEGDQFITRMEAQGQRQLVASTQIPTELLGGTEDELRALGFELGAPPEGDKLFRHAKLPEGWRKTASDHDMWSYVVDRHGRRRLSMFYKAAFYDRRAHARLSTVEGYAYDLLHIPGTPFVVDDWATVEALTAALDDIRDRAVSDRALYEPGGRHPSADRTADLDREIAACDRLLARVAAATAGGA